MPYWAWAIERISAGEAQTLVVATLRHLAISVAHLPPLLRWFAESDRRLVAIDLRLDTATEAGRLAAFALAGVGGWEYERLSARHSIRVLMPRTPDFAGMVAPAGPPWSGRGRAD